MAPRSDVFDLGGLRLTSGEGRHLELEVVIDPFELAGERYTAEPAQIPVRLDVSKTTGDGYALRLKFAARLAGPCMRCLSGAEPEFAVEAREISQPGGGAELESPYVDHGELNLRALGPRRPRPGPPRPDSLSARLRRTVLGLRR